MNIDEYSNWSSIKKAILAEVKTYVDNEVKKVGDDIVGSMKLFGIGDNSIRIVDDGKRIVFDVDDNEYDDGVKYFDEAFNLLYKDKS